MSLFNQRPPKPVHLPVGKTFKTRSGHILSVLYRLLAGGQGTAFVVKDLDTGRNMVMKIFHRQFANRDTKKRTEFIIDRRFHLLSPAFRPPLDMIVSDEFMGYVADWAEGEPVDTVVAKMRLDVPQSIIASLMLSQAFLLLHDQDVLHGDVRDTNIRIGLKGDSPVISIIDWDNICAPHLPPPPGIGSVRYAAPELFTEVDKGKWSMPTRASECYALAAVFHELIYWRHFLVGHDETEESSHKAKCKGYWLHDPELNSDQNLGGYPASFVNLRLLALFRRAFSLNQENRPLLPEWRAVLTDALHKLFPCPMCGGIVLADYAKNTCPFCARPFPTLKIATPSGRAIVINSSEVLVGRHELGGSRKISRRHAYFRKLGPDVYVQSEGQAGIFIRRGKDWKRLDAHKLVMVESGELLRIADVEIKLVRCDMNGSEL